MKTPLARQVSTILHDKVRRIAQTEYARANTLPNGKPRARYVPYTLPAIVDTLCAMISECADEATSAERLEEIASFATTGEVRERAFPNV
jgi:hypothetical protein